jgi:hypothetical protein
MANRRFNGRFAGKLRSTYGTPAKAAKPATLTPAQRAKAEHWAAANGTPLPPIGSSRREAELARLWHVMPAASKAQ